MWLQQPLLGRRYGNFGIHIIIGGVLLCDIVLGDQLYKETFGMHWLIRSSGLSRTLAVNSKQKEQDAGYGVSLFGGKIHWRTKCKAFSCATVCSKKGLLGINSRPGIHSASTKYHGSNYESNEPTDMAIRSRNKAGFANDIILAK